MKGLHQIIARCLTLTAGARERERFGNWRASDARRKVWAETLSSWWRHPAPETANPRLEEARQRLWLRIEARPTLQLARRSYFLRVAASCAAAVLLCAVSIFIASRTGYFESENRMAVSTRAGQQSCVELPDGSTVWLNSETRIEFTTDKSARRVTMQGEACFDVKPDARHPFLVETGGACIRVLGTKFNVRHYAETGRVAASLLSGHITMRVPGFEGMIDLVPGEKVVYDRAEGTFTKSRINANNDILWQNGILIFENEPFAQMVKMLERYYDVTVLYDENDFENIHFTGSVNNLSIYKVLEFINLSVPVDYAVENKTVRMELRKTPIRRSQSRQTK